MNNNTLGLLGAILGLSIVLGSVVLTNRDIKEELEAQVRSSLKTTRTLVRHYAKAVNSLTANDGLEEVPSREYEEAWDAIPER